ncbi:MAG: dynamin family protein [Rhodospirillales bacterium]|nr:dynamin family protein [Rhodospirillales bacterium]
MPAQVEAVAALIGQALACQPEPPDAQAATRERLRVLAVRLAAARLQVAVVGQFKRGKSSLLNALLGIPVLPMGVVPLTAITTVLSAGPPRLRLEFLDGKRIERAPPNLDGLRAGLATLVTEDGNPANRLGLRQVQARLPAPLLARGVVLLDTPGIGSTLRRNTEAAIAALPECDLALFVVSPDPPITEAELAYLAQVRATAARIVVVLNKIDMQEPAERDVTLGFLRRALTDQARLPADTEIFLVSARAALRAREEDDPAALVASGVPALEQGLLELLATEGPALLAGAIAGKAAELVAVLRLDAEIAATACRLPLAELEQRIAAFDAGIADLAAERTEAADRIAGDRARLRALIEQRAAVVGEQLSRQLDREVADLPRPGEDIVAARRRLAGLVPECLVPAVAAATASVQDALWGALHRHEDRIARLIETVRQNAAAAMDLVLVAPPARGAAELPRLTAWHTDGRTETLAGISTGWVERLLPAGARRRRAQGRLRAEAKALVVRNVEALRWSLRQGVDAAMGGFAAALDADLDGAIAACRTAMTAARQRHDSTAGAAAAVVAERDAVVAEFSRIESALRGLRETQGHIVPPRSAHQAGEARR